MIKPKDILCINCIHMMEENETDTKALCKARKKYPDVNYYVYGLENNVFHTCEYVRGNINNFLYQCPDYKEK